MQRGEAYELLASYPLPDTKTVVVAEVANVHDGSLGNCHAFIDAVADAGADAVKFQCHIAAAESTEHEQFPARFQFLQARHKADQTAYAKFPFLKDRTTNEYLTAQYLLRQHLQL